MRIARKLKRIGYLDLAKRYRLHSSHRKRYGAWERRYNHKRFSMALSGLTAAEKLDTCLLQSAPSSLPITITRRGGHFILIPLEFPIRTRF
jgi:hypothetical protein